MIHPPENIDFKIRDSGAVSAAFLAHGISDFSGACAYIKQLPYRRNSHKENVLVAIQESCGTCSTKHALLKAMAEENNCVEVRLMLGIYRLHAGNAAQVGPILENFQLDYLPEAHWYLRIQGKIQDYTFPDFKIPKLEEELLYEMEISPEKIGTAKDQIHRNFLVQWLQGHPEIRLSLEELWLIREKCILALSSI